MFGGLGNIAEMLKQARQMKGRFEEVQAEIARQRFTAEAGGGAVSATVDGKGTLVDIKIQPDATADVELLEDMIQAAVGTAARQAQEHVQQEMSRLTGGLNIPGLSEMIGGADPGGQ